ncbi:endocuticle structural glycoprotein ABD-5-like [Ctenocephalides felis]|uniref:endocuticle structural glycoprotein ABD-5-like n=1 Tax=Ctenocephalides felis TaxID=7515 RepID=UPI000E6E375E|nr:endocuticle structural glycoprotein ABD-5-like [Ctenocephalides felis]
MIALCKSAPVNDGKKAEIIRYENVPSAHEGDGYKFFFETSDGQTRKEEGKFVGPDQILTVYGTYTYKDQNDEKFQVSYEADEKGYRVLSIQQRGKEQEELIFVPVVPETLSSHVLASLVG